MLRDVARTRFVAKGVFASSLIRHHAKMGKIATCGAEASNGCVSEAPTPTSFNESADIYFREFDIANIISNPLKGRLVLKS